MSGMGKEAGAAGGRERGPWLLAWDLSGSRGLLVLEGAGALLSRTLEGAAETASLFSCAELMLAEAGICARDLGLLGAARGPGAFTGVRTAVMAAKTLGEVLGIPVVAPESLAVIAAAVETPGHVFVAADARRGQVYYALYRVEEGSYGACPVTLEGPAAAPPDAAAASLRRWMEELGEGIVLAGSGVEVYRDLWPRGLGRKAGGAPRPRGLVSLCRGLYGRGDTVDPLRLTPLYLRHPDVGKKGGA
ncbi:MAG: tRNA (adenosine(37)-N6)-threonylcarbamoyltransferase complex dimerization subunit type 1 TsaB [Actinobacteria bacterium]|nr:tRNA (adenosine(37)-N6)-threonylcarbamoyltransferase complex dimerization subunit type 1 TsaB [Actinomycetota bacterium]